MPVARIPIEVELDECKEDLADFLAGKKLSREQQLRIAKFRRRIKAYIGDNKREILEQKIYGSNLGGWASWVVGGRGSDTLETALEKFKARLRRPGMTAAEKEAAANSSRLGEKLADAAYEGNLDRVQELLDAGADVDTINGRGHTPLICAVISRNVNPEVVQELLDAGADFNIPDQFRSGGTPLHFPSTPEVLQELLDAGASIHTKNDKRDTALRVNQNHFYRDNEVTALLQEVEREQKEAFLQTVKTPTVTELKGLLSKRGLSAIPETYRIPYLEKKFQLYIDRMVEEGRTNGLQAQIEDMLSPFARQYGQYRTNIENIIGYTEARIQGAARGRASAAERLEVRRAASPRDRGRQ